MAARISRRTALNGIASSVGLVACATGARAPGDAERKHPNIIFIMADDLGYADLSLTGSRHIDTPYIDSIGSSGIVFRQGYANSAICSPTRTALLTGCYQYRFEVGLEEPLISSIALEAKLGAPRGRPTLASVLKEQGYRTALFGKWHLGFPPDFTPMMYGYDEYFGIAGGAADYFRHRAVRGGVERGSGLFKGNEEIQRVGYLTDLLGDAAATYIDDSDDDPFFLSLHFTAPHWPWEGPNDQQISQEMRDYFHRDGGTLETYKAMVESMDENVGKVLRALDRTGQRENTIIVFTSDNGGERFSDNWPFTGVKGELLEGGIRVPLFVQWPRRIQAGGESEQVIASMDFLPSFLGMIDAPNLGGLDGMDLSSQIVGEEPVVERTLYWRFKANEQAAIRSGDWKYLKLGDQESLFNVAEDPRERAQLKDLHPEKLEALKMKFHEWNLQMLPYPARSRTEDVKEFYADRY